MKVHVFYNSPSPVVAIYNHQPVGAQGEDDYGSDIKQFIKKVLRGRRTPVQAHSKLSHQPTETDKGDSCCVEPATSQSCFQQTGGYGGIPGQGPSKGTQGPKPGCQSHSQSTEPWSELGSEERRYKKQNPQSSSHIGVF